MLWLDTLIGLFSFGAATFAYLGWPTPGGVNANTILFLPAAACGALALLLLLARIVFGMLLKV